MAAVQDEDEKMQTTATAHDEPLRLYSGQKGMWSIIRRFPISADSVDKVQKFLKLHGTLGKEDMSGKQFGWAHAAPLKLGKGKSGKIVLLAQERQNWKVVVPKEQVEKFCREAILNPTSKVPLTRDAGYHILQKDSIGISRRSFYAFLAKQELSLIHISEPTRPY